MNARPKPLKISSGAAKFASISKILINFTSIMPHTHRTVVVQNWDVFSLSLNAIEFEITYPSNSHQSKFTILLPTKVYVAHTVHGCGVVKHWNWDSSSRTCSILILTCLLVMLILSPSSSSSGRCWRFCAIGCFSNHRRVCTRFQPGQHSRDWSFHH